MWLDPMDWSMEQVKFWLEWAIAQFSLEGVAVEQFDLTGIELCQLSHDDFIQLVPNDIDNIFWTHLELLRKCKFVGMYDHIKISSMQPFSLRFRDTETVQVTPLRRSVASP